MLNKQVTKLTGINDQDYIDWCKENKRAIHKDTTKEYFFARVIDGRISKKDGKLIVKGK